LSESSHILAHSHCALLKIFKFLLLEFHHSQWHVMSSEAVLEFLPIDSFWLLMGFNICIPPVYSRSDQLMCCKQNLLSVVALNNLQLLFYCLQPIIGIHGLDGVRECQRFGPLKLSKFVTWLLLWRWLILWCLLHVCHSLLLSLQHLILHNQYLLQCWWWSRVGIVVVIVLMTRL
jgi:hypothetical protein